MEVETILEQAVQGHIRKEQTGTAFSVTKPSQALQDLLDINKRELTVDSLQETKQELEVARQNAVVLRVVLSAEPTGPIKAKLVRWFREFSDQTILLRFGIQPSIAGGCLVYTPNHLYDLSLRSKILSSNINFHEVIDRVGK